ncbi:Gamma-glutamyltranspeptidase 3 [Thelohanellus kitauei]|uniref:Gamma-glutamyltranspeptidase 3 n=1 Tax=Thelohanellus kitauei TaxID=669202 RepID=A0A0C2MFR5_THEKT|nr:Gamma-glutamyltranspeptidase 3 [Thelohanellus kitauei]
MHSSGIGGGGVMIVYTPSKRESLYNINYESVVYDYREVVPRKLPEILKDVDPKSLALGGLSIAIPGEVAGLYEAWKDHGKLPWKQLVEPAINLSRYGFPFHHRIWEASNFMKSFILHDEGLR